MTTVQDANGQLWSVERKWRPFPELDFDDDDILGILGLILAIPALIVWPFWLAAKFLGVRWIITVERDGRRVGKEKVRGWDASKRRIAEIARNVGSRSAHF